VESLGHQLVGLVADAVMKESSGSTAEERTVATVNGYFPESIPPTTSGLYQLTKKQLVKI
jgi:hypothetical protein